MGQSRLNTVEIIFYTRQDCRLCDDMESKLNAFIANLGGQIAVDVLMRDIDDHSQWYKRYREYVPVLVVNDEEVCHYFFDRDELMDAIKGAGRCLDDLPVSEYENQAGN